MSIANVIARINNIKTKIKGIASIDPNYKLFGASVHRYRFAPPMEDFTLLGLEKLWRVRLPDTYRRWITMVGNGGVGAGLGLYALRLDLKSFGGDFPGKDERFELEEKDADEDVLWAQGNLCLSNTGIGQGNEHLLITKGEKKGAVWFKSSIDEIFWEPKYDDFLDWMEYWIEKQYPLAKRAHQRRTKRMKRARSDGRFYMLGRIYQKELGQARNAAAWYQKALDRDINNINAALGMVEIFNFIGSYDSAINFAQKYRKLCDPNPPASGSQNWIFFTHEIGRAFHSRGLYEEAAKELDLAQERLKQDWVLYLPPRIESHIRTGDYQKAQKLLELVWLGKGTSLVNAEVQSRLFLNRDFSSESKRILRTLQAIGFQEEANWLSKLQREAERM